ncbi:MAG: hypothetical protein SGARI_002621, partial [Bacillariaceae sp.]
MAPTTNAPTERSGSPPPPRQLSQALNETFDKAFSLFSGGTPKALLNRQRRNNFFPESESSSTLSSLTQQGETERGATATSAPPSSTPRTKFQETADRVMGRIKNVSFVDTNYYYGSLKSAVAKDDPEQVKSILFMALPAAFLVVAELFFGVNSKILYTLVCLSLATTVFKLLPEELVNKYLPALKEKAAPILEPLEKCNAKLKAKVAEGMAELVHKYLPALKEKATPILEPLEKCNAKLQQKVADGLVAFTVFRKEKLGIYIEREIVELQKDLQHTELHLTETKRQLARLQEQHRAERLESSEFQQESLQEAIETLKAEHAQALLFQQQEYDTLLPDDSAHRVALKQTLHGQETLLQAERKRSKSMKDSIDRLEQ